MFYLGTHEPHWVGHLDVPLFLSRRRLVRYPVKARALAPWALDSGGFTELSLHGKWTIPTPQYVGEARKWRDKIGRLTWAAPQDWMCEPWILAKTGFSVRTHQQLTIASIFELRALATDIHWVPVLQGWVLEDYLRHLDMYDAAGLDLRQEPVVGVGSVCRRQGTEEATEIFRTLHGRGLRLHGFGLKTKGLLASAQYLVSSDSLAWSYNARKNPPMEGCTHARCNNCPRWAMRWRARLLEKLQLGALTPGTGQPILTSPDPLAIRSP